MPYKNPEDRPSYPAYDKKPATKKARAQRNKARRIMEREGAVKKGDGKDVDHATALSKGGKTVRSNLRVKAASDNRSFPRNSNHTMKKNT